MVSRSQTHLVALALLCGASAASAAVPQPTRACQDPGALGTARTITIGGAPDLGLKTYPQTLDLQDHEVVLTFDDGPSGSTTPMVLDALATQCVKATFFLIGRNAQVHPALVRREISEGHSVGHHSWDHPAVTLRGLEPKAAILDIAKGMEADDKAAGYGAWTGTPHVRFFRFPGFGDSPETVAYLKAHGIANFGADLWASDWIPMTPEAQLDRLMSRLRTAGRGIILLHDIKRQTADMLPRFLVALKTEGFHVVQMVPGGTTTPTRPAPDGWTSETEPTLSHIRPKAGATGFSTAPAGVSKRVTSAAAPASADAAPPLRPSED